MPTCWACAPRVDQRNYPSSRANRRNAQMPGQGGRHGDPLPGPAVGLECQSTGCGPARAGQPARRPPVPADGGIHQPGRRAVEIVPVIDLGGVKPQAGLDESQTSFRVSANTRCRTSREVESLVWSSTSRARATLQKIVLNPGATARPVWRRPQRLLRSAARRLGRGRNPAATGRGLLGAVDCTSLRCGADSRCPDPGPLGRQYPRALSDARDANSRPAGLLLWPGLLQRLLGPGRFVRQRGHGLVRPGRSHDADGYADYLLLHQQAHSKIPHGPPALEGDGHRPAHLMPACPADGEQDLAGEVPLAADRPGRGIYQTVAAHGHFRRSA